MSEIESVAQAIEKTYEEFADPTPAQRARAAIETLDRYRAEERRKNCKHHLRIGTGHLSSDGSGWNTWFCQECGTSYDSRALSPSHRENAGVGK